MAPITIDFGARRSATLYGRGEIPDTRPSLDKQRRDTAEFIRNWPASQSHSHDAQKYIRQLNLLSYAPIGVQRTNSVAILKAAVESGQVMVLIERKAPRSGGTAGGAPSSARPFPLAMRGTSNLSAPRAFIDKPIPSWATPSDVSVDALMDYLESVIGGGSAGGAAKFAGGASTLLGHAKPFDYIEGPVSDSIDSLAASTNNPNFAAKMLGYERKTFGQMLHVLKPANGLGPADNVIFHDSGDVEFKGIIIDNIHDYAP